MLKKANQTRSEVYLSKFRKTDFEMVLHPQNDTLGLEIVEKVKSGFMIPDDFSREDLLGPGKMTLKFVSNTMVLLSLIYNISNYKKYTDKKSIPRPFARLHSHILRNFILTLPRETPRFLSTLQAMNWIEIDSSYHAGTKSKGYRIGERFLHSQWTKASWKDTLEKHVPEILQKSLISRSKEVLYCLWERAAKFISTWENMEEGELKRICEVTGGILAGLSVINREHLHAVINKCAQEKTAEYKLRWRHMKSHADWTVEQRCENYHQAINAIENQNFSIVCHDSRYMAHTDRLFTNWTNCKREFRAFFRLNGLSMVSIDIKSCQPALLSSFYNSSAIDQEEKGKFLNIIVNHDIYDFLSQEGMDRPKAKEAMFLIMFGRNHQQNTPIGRFFKASFPVLAER